MTSNSRRSSDCCERSTNTDRSRGLSSRRCAEQRNQREIDGENDCAMEEPVREEECCVPPQASREEPEEECPRDPRYDAKELRDAVRTLRPFVKLIADSNNPYARLVAQEVCDTYYRLCYPDQNPEDVINAVDCWAKRDKTAQIRVEFCRYIPQSGVREWVSLRDDEPLPDDMDPNVAPRRKACMEPVDLFGCDETPRRRQRHQAAGADHQRLDTKAIRERLFGSAAVENAGTRRETAGSDDPCRPCLASSINRQTVYYSRTADAPPPPLPRENCPGLSAELLDDNGRDETTTGLVAGAFAKLSVAHREIEKKKEALRRLTENYLYACSAAAEAAEMDEAERPPSRRNTSDASTSATAITPPVPAKPFDPTEYNTNAFRDRDFVRLLPFYAIIHSQLEHVTKKQREQFALNMTDPIMSALHHVAYEMGDPRLKNELVVEHVKLITRNTWEIFFYRGAGKMPVVPMPPIYRPISPSDAMCSFGPRQRSNRDRSGRGMSPSEKTF